MLAAINWDTVQTSVMSTLGAAVAVAMFWCAFGWLKKYVSPSSIRTVLKKPSTWKVVSQIVYEILSSIFNHLLRNRTACSVPLESFPHAGKPCILHNRPFFRYSDGNRLHLRSAVQ
jgi:hypothetical protein